ncbi:MAG: hypothetical protein IPL08_12790 [Saprospiraceae bacterium]|nr:hypothetical protein [Saprospiraceae bacterium]
MTSTLKVLEVLSAHRILFWKQAIQYFDAVGVWTRTRTRIFPNKAIAYALLNDVVKARFYVENEAEPALIRSKGNNFKQNLMFLC